MNIKEYNRILHLSLEKYINELNTILTNNNVCYSHGIEHALSVLNHSIIALKYNKIPITPQQELAVKLASLLHDADDRKFFPLNTDYNNVKYILRNKKPDFVNLVIRMIDLVSSSKNADNIPDDVIGKEWMLIPRYCDRIEAIGIIGIKRCYQYNITINNKIFLNSTPKPKNINEIWEIATKERYNNYKGKSVSMMDHYFDKLIRLGLFEFDNEYLMNEAHERTQIILKFVLYFSSLENMTDSDIINFIKNNNI
jgi:HD superfamily phosphodiesterase